MTRVLHAAVAAVALALLAGCAAQSASGGDVPRQPATASATPTATPTATATIQDDELWPEGASADTPRCQDVSPATLAAVNASLTTPQPGWDDHVDALRAHPDPELAVWIISGSLGVGAGAVTPVAWATTDDPTRADFAGGLRSVGDAAATISSAPALAVVVTDNPDGSGIPGSAC